MKKQALMGVLLTTLLFSVAVSARAQSQGSRIVSDIPFSFQIGSETLPAGEYIVRAMSDDMSLLLIERKAGGSGRMTLSQAVKCNAEGHARLVFNKYGDRYFLSAVWGEGRDGRVLPESGRERRLRRELERTAGTKASEPEVVTVAAHRASR